MQLRMAQAYNRQAKTHFESTLCIRLSYLWQECRLEILIEVPDNFTRAVADLTAISTSE